MTTEFSLTVAVSRVSSVIETVNKANRKLMRYGFPCIDYDLSEPYVYKDDLRPWGVEVQKFNFRTPGDMVTLIPGWSLVAVIDRRNDLVTQIDKDVDFSEIEKYRYRDVCDHCGTRRERKAYLIVKKDGDSALKAVGTSCADAYLGTSLTHAICSAATIWQSIENINQDEEFCFGGRFDMVYELKNAVACVLASIREYGYVPASRAENPWEATSNSAKLTCEAHIMGARSTKTPGVTEKAPTKDDIKKAGEIIAWVRENFVGDSNFACNVQAVFSRDHVTEKMWSFVAHPVNKFLTDAVKAATSTSDYIGNPGERMRNVSLTVTGAHGYESMFGSGVIYTFADDNGNCVVWSTTSYNELEIGSKISATFTIKEHGEFRGIKQTKVSRLRVM